MARTCTSTVPGRLAAAVVLCVVVAAMWAVPTAHALKLPVVLDSHMVLRRAGSRVWGWANSTETLVTVLLDSSKYTATPDATGAWAVNIPAMPAGCGHTLHFSTSASSITLGDICFGDVFVCSGQSNMEFSVNDAFNSTAEIADSINYPTLRLFTVARAVADTPQSDCTSKANYTWAVSAPDAFVPPGGAGFSWFSATCYFAGRDVYRALGGRIPLGLIASDWGGQTVEAFSSPDALADKTCGGTQPGRDEPITAWPGSPDMMLSAPPGPEPNPGPMQLWNAMIYPLLNYSVDSFLWYQGEANAGDPASYACRFPAMIADWRVKWGLGDVPFYFVQLAAFTQDYALIRQAQMAALKLPNVGYAIAVDIGDLTSPEGSIHPRRKQEVGRRLSLAILDITYHEDVPRFGPQLVSKVFGSTPDGRGMATLTFSNASALHANGTADCVACCNESPFLLGDGDTMARANFTISGNVVTVVATAATAAEPSVVWYDFEGFPQCALYNTAGGGPDSHIGLPADPFGTLPPPPKNYTLVFRQTWPTPWPVGALSVNPSDPLAPNYAILDQLEQMRDPVSKRLDFLLQWPLARGMNWWRQTSNPVTTTNRTVTGYTPINVSSTAQGWGGLRYGGEFSLLDGSVSAGANIWYYAVGSFAPWNSGIPAFDNVAAQKVELLVKAKNGSFVVVCSQRAPAYFQPGEFRTGNAPGDAAYCILDQLESFRGDDGAFEFILLWPDFNEFSQISNPASDSAVEGSAASGLQMHTDSWGGGLRLSASDQAVIDGSVDALWWYAVGDYARSFPDGMPAWPTAVQAMTELFVKRSS